MQDFTPRCKLSEDHHEDLELTVVVAATSAADWRASYQGGGGGGEGNGLYWDGVGKTVEESVN